MKTCSIIAISKTKKSCGLKAQGVIMKNKYSKDQLKWLLLSVKTDTFSNGRHWSKHAFIGRDRAFGSDGKRIHLIRGVESDISGSPAPIHRNILSSIIRRVPTGGSVSFSRFDVEKGQRGLIRIESASGALEYEQTVKAEKVIPPDIDSALKALRNHRKLSGISWWMALDEILLPIRGSEGVAILNDKVLGIGVWREGQYSSFTPFWVDAETFKSAKLKSKIYEVFQSDPEFPKIALNIRCLLDGLSIGGNNADYRRKHGFWDKVEINYLDRGSPIHIVYKGRYELVLQPIVLDNKDYKGGS